MNCLVCWFWLLSHLNRTTPKFVLGPKPPHSGDLEAIVLVRIWLPCSYMPKRTELGEKTHQVPKQTLHTSQVKVLSVTPWTFHFESITWKKQLNVIRNFATGTFFNESGLALMRPGPQWCSVNSVRQPYMITWSYVRLHVFWENAPKRETFFSIFLEEKDYEL